MVSKEEVLTWSKCRGLDNVNDPARLKASNEASDDFYLSTAENIDVDRFGSILMRRGYSQVDSNSYSSLFPWKGKIYGVRDGNLVMLDTYFNMTILRSGVGEWSMVFQEAGDKLFYSNGIVIGYIKDETAYTLSDPNLEGKRIMPPGDIMEVYNARLWVAAGKLLIFSDAAAYHYHDLEENILQFKEDVTMLRAVQDGMFVSAEKTYFIRTANPNEVEDFELEHIDDRKAIKGTSYKKRGVDVLGEHYPVAVLWATERGLCIGGNGGSFRNLTEVRYNMPTAFGGATIVRQSLNLNQAIVITTD